MKRICLALLISFLMLMGIRAAFGAPVRVKELVDVQGVRENALYGYGLVVGLAGTGDTERVFFTSQSISGMLGRLGIRIDPRRRSGAQRRRGDGDRAAAFVLAAGTRIDVSVGSMGNARSLAGGVLLITPLTGPDGQVYALAQGPVQAGGFDVGLHGSSMQKNQPTSGRVPVRRHRRARRDGEPREEPDGPGPEDARLHHVESHRRGDQRRAQGRHAGARRRSRVGRGDDPGRVQGQGGRR